MSRTVDQVIQGVIAELERSIVIHGDWSGYDRDRMAQTIMAEFREFLSAWQVNDETGEHGMIAEARQLATVCIKYLVCREGLVSGVEP